MNMVNIINFHKQENKPKYRIDRMAAVLMLSLLMLLSINMKAQCPDYGPQKTVGSSFHSSLIIDSANIVRYWGDEMSADGLAGDVLSPLTLTGYTGTPVAVAAGSNSTTDHQHYLLTTTGLYGWGYSTNTIISGTAGDVALTNMVLPTGITASMISFIEAANGGIAIVTTSGDVWVKAGTGSICSPAVYGDATGTLNNNWHHVTTAPGVFLTGVERLSFSGTAAMALTTSGQVYIWGTRTYLGDGSAMVANRDRATLIPLSSILPGVSAADVNVINFTSGITLNASEYILSTNGNLYAVGYNNAGQLGQGNTTDLLTWTAVKDASGTGTLSNIIQLTSNNPFSFNRYSVGVLTSNNIVYLWGTNDRNMAGAPTGNVLLPRIPDNYNISGANVSYVKMGGHTTLTFLEGTNKFCYIGHKINGSMGDGTSIQADVPSFDCYNTPGEYICPAPQKFCVNPSSNDLVATANHATVLVSDFPSFKYWGEATSSYLTPGLNELDPQDLFEYNGVPKGVAAGSVGSTLDAATSQMWALTDEGLWGWGYSANTISAIAGNVVNTSVALPAGITASQVSFIRASRGGVAVVTTAGEVWVKAGAGSSCVALVYGDGSATLNSAWHQVTTAAPGNPALTGVTELSFAGTAAMAVTPAGVYVWGENTLLGNGSASADRNRATLIPAIPGITAKSVEIIQAGTLNAAQFILGSNGKIYGVGENKDGVLGQNNTTDATSWVIVQNATNTGDLVSVSKLASNNPYAFDSYSIGALTINGTLYLWGDNNGSRLGGVATRYLLPQTPATILPGTISNFDIGGHFTIVFKKGTSIFCFVGHQVNGSLGDGTISTSTVSTPECATTPVIPQCAGVAYDISGNVYNDLTGLSNNLVDGTLLTTVNGSQLYANLLDNNGFVLATIPITGGTYSFQDYPAGSYTVQISTTAGTIGNTAPPVGLPGSWIPIGEQIGTTPGANIDSPTDAFLPVVLAGTDVNNANFGLVIPKPIAINDTTSTTEDTPITFSLSSNDFSVLNNIDPTTVTLINTPPLAQGTVVNNGDGTITFTPAPNFNGTVLPFDYYVCTSGGLCDTATVYITVSPVDDLPIANADAPSTNEDTPLSSTVVPNDVMSGDGGNTFNNACAVCTSTSNGTLVFNPDGTYTYTPNANYNGNDQFIYELCDADGDCDTAIVNITVSPVNDLPVAEADESTVPEDGSTTIPVLTNDTFGGDGPSTGTITITTAPTNGTASVDDNGTPNDPTDDQITYTPNANYNGSDAIIYEICDSNGDCDTAIVNITVSPVNDPPIVPDTVVTTPEDTPITVCLPITDVDTGEVHTAVVGCNPVNGTITSGPTVNGAEVCVTYTPNTNYNGSDSICVIVCDAGGLCDTGVIYINIPPSNDTLTTITPIEVLDTICNITIPSGNNVEIKACDGSTAGTTPIGGIWNIDSQTGCLVYTAGPLKGNDTICISACDTIRGYCNTTIIVVTVLGNPPTAVNDSTSTPPNEPVTIPILSNDTTHDEDPITLCQDAIITQPVHGTVVVNQDGTLTYTPSGTYNGLDSLQYQICDPEGNDTAWVYILVEDCIFPNAFSPNNDGINDYFVIPCLEGEAVFSVWNRWGIEVYRNDTYMNNWDGLYKGNPLPEGTYYYILQYTKSSGEEVNRAGFISLRR